MLELSDEEIPRDSRPLMGATDSPQPRRWLPLGVTLALVTGLLYALGYAFTSGSPVPSLKYPGSAKHITGFASKAPDAAKESDDTKSAALVQELHDVEAELAKLKTDTKAEVDKLKTEVKSLEAHQQAAVVSPPRDATTSSNRDENRTNEGLLPLGPNKNRPYCVDSREMQVLLVQQELELQQSRCEALNGTSLFDTAKCKAQVFYLKARLAATEGGPVPGGGILVAVVAVLAGIALLGAVAFSVIVLFLDSIRDDSGNRTLCIYALGSWARTAPWWPARGESVKVEGQAAVTLLLPLAFLVLGVVVSLLFGAGAGSSPVLLGVGAGLIFRAMILEVIYAHELEAEAAQGITRRTEEEQALAPKEAATKEDEGALPKTIWGFILRDLKGLGSLRAPNFLLSKLELLDAQSDGLTTAAAFFLDSAAQARFTASFASNGPLVHTAISALGLPGLMLLCLLLAVFTQCGALVMSQLGPRPGDEVPCEFAGFSISPSKLKADAMEATIFRCLLSALARTLCEGIPQILLQGSMLMAVGQSLLQQPLLVISLALSLFTSCRKALEVTGSIAEIGKDACKRGTTGDTFILAVLAVSVAALWLLLLLAAWRTAMLQLCPCHVWGITSGCQVLL